MWKSQTTFDVKSIKAKKNATDDDDWETDPDFVNDSTEQSLRWGSKTVESTLQARDTNLDLQEVANEVQSSHRNYVQQGLGQFATGYGGKFGIQNIQDKSAVGHDYTEDPKPHKTVEISKEFSNSKVDIRSKVDHLSLESGRNDTNLNDKRKLQQEQIKNLREEGEQYQRNREEDFLSLKNKEYKDKQNAHSQREQAIIDKENKATKEREQKYTNNVSQLSPAELRAAEMKAAIAERDSQMKAQANRKLSNKSFQGINIVESNIAKPKEESIDLLKKTQDFSSVPSASATNVSISGNEETKSRKASYAAEVTLPPRQVDDTDDEEQGNDDEWDDTETSAQADIRQQTSREAHNNTAEDTSTNEPPLISSEQFNGQKETDHLTAKALYDYDAGAEDELSIKEDDILINVQMIVEGWATAINQRTGDRYLEIQSTVVDRC